MEDIKTKIRNYFIRSINGYNVQDSDDVFEMRLVHSMFAMQLAMFIEKTFDFELDDNDLDINNFKSIDIISSFIKNKMAADSSADK